MTNIEVVNNLQHHSNKGHIKVKKTNMPPKSHTFTATETPTHIYKNIRTTKLVGKIDYTKPQLSDNTVEHVIEWSNYCHVRVMVLAKIVMAHKMYGYLLLIIVVT